MCSWILGRLNGVMRELESDASLDDTVRTKQLKLYKIKGELY